MTADIVIYHNPECGTSRNTLARFQIFDDMRLDPGIADQRERVARGAALGIVVDDDVSHCAGSFSSR